MNVSKNENWKHIKFQEISQFIHLVCHRFMVDTLKFRWRFNLKGVLPVAYLNQTYSRHSVYYFFWDWRVDIYEIFADMLHVFFSTDCHFVAALSAWSYKDRSCISRRTMMYCGLWGGVRMSNHCDVTFTEWGPPLPLILSTIAFDECTGW